MKKSVCSFLFGLTVALLSQTSTGFALDAKDCGDNVMKSFFPVEFVDAAFEKYKIPQEKRAAIKNALAQREQTLIQTFEAKASRMNPNPLKDQSQEEAAKKLFRDTMLESFSEAFTSNGVTDRQTIVDILNDVQKSRLDRVGECRKAGYGPKMPQQQGQPQQGQQQQDRDDDDDDNDNDDDEEEENNQG